MFSFYISFKIHPQNLPCFLICVFSCAFRWQSFMFYSKTEHLNFFLIQVDFTFQKNIRQLCCTVVFNHQQNCFWAYKKIILLTLFKSPIMLFQILPSMSEIQPLCKHQPTMIQRCQFTVNIELLNPNEMADFELHEETCEGSQ